MGVWSCQSGCLGRLLLLAGLGCCWLGWVAAGWAGLAGLGYWLGCCCWAGLGCWLGWAGLLLGWLGWAAAGWAGLLAGLGLGLGCLGRLLLLAGLAGLLGCWAGWAAAAGWARLLLGWDVGWLG